MQWQRSKLAQRELIFSLQLMVLKEKDGLSINIEKKN